MTNQNPSSTSGSGNQQPNGAQAFPEEGPLRWQHFSTSLAAGNWSAAECAARAFGDSLLGARAWYQLAQTHFHRSQWSEARTATKQGMALSVDVRPLRLLYALTIEQQGEIESAADELSQLAAQGADPRIVVHLARTLRQSGREAAAQIELERAIERWPTDVALHVALVHLRWQQDPSEQAMTSLEQAIAAFPRELKLRLVAADLWRQAGQSQRSLEQLKNGLQLAPQSPEFLTSMGVVLDGLDRPEEALKYLRAAVARAPEAAALIRNLVPTLLRLGHAHEVLGLTERLLRQAPDDQLVIAWRAVALRLLGDARYAELHDYQRLVRTYSPAAPVGFRDIGAFNAALAGEFMRLHRQQQRPLDQSLRGGSQTSRNLPMDNPTVAAFFAMIDTPIRDYIASLRDDGSHPLDRRKAASYRIAGSWSVALRPGGFHINHVHPRGWISSAYYVEVPPEEVGTNAGWLKFGEPGFPVPGCSPEHFVKPQPGLLVLFPSYLWHGTVAFARGERRLTAAFDVAPA